MMLYDVETDEEIAAAIAEQYPDQIEFEPGKVAEYDPDQCRWIYHSPDSEDVIIQL